MSLEDTSNTLRIEDVVYMLNSIVDDIDQMYVNAPNMAMDDTLGESEVLSKTGSFICLPALPSSPAILASSTEDSDLEMDLISLCYSPSSSASSPTSSAFTTPSNSPTGSGFSLYNEDINAPPQDCGLYPPVQRMTMELGPLPNRSESSWPDLENIDCSSLDSPLVVFPASLAVDSKSEGLTYYDCLPLIGPEQSDSYLIYETPHPIGSQIVHKATSTGPALEHMPNISPPHLTISPPALPPRPASAGTNMRDPPPHLPALRSPVVPSTPRLEQSEGWASQYSQTHTFRQDLWSTYLVKQRQRARITITHAASLAEPRALPVYQPKEKYARIYPCSNMSPPRSRMIGAYTRRVNIAPRVLGARDWDPWRRGGALDRATLAEKRRQMRMWEDTEQERALEISIMAEGVSTDDDAESEGAEIPLSDRLSYKAVHEETPGELEITENLVTNGKSKAVAEDSGFSMDLCVKDGNVVLPNIATVPNINPGPVSITADDCVLPSDNSTAVLDTMQVYVEDGIRLSPPDEEPTPSLGSTASVDPAQTSIPVLTRRSAKSFNKYAPRSNSPLGQSFVVPHTATQSRSFEGDAFTTGRAWRKFTSMIF